MTTQYATASYQEIIDLHTETDKVSVIGIHTPVTETPYDMLQPFFDAFQKYHYDGCNLTMVPAARLPADPSQVSYGAGEPPIDPRDLLNPILWHGCHGESLGSVLNQFYSDDSSSTDVRRYFSDSAELNEKSTAQLGDIGIFESLYYRALVDKTWLKAHPQRGFRKSGLRPLVYEVSTDRQFVPGLSGSYLPTIPVTNNIPGDPSDNSGLSNGFSRSTLGNTSGAFNAVGSLGLQTTNGGTGEVTVSLPYGRDSSFFTSRLHGLGWLDTRVRTASSAVTSDVITGSDAYDTGIIEDMYVGAENRQRINYLPRLFMGMILMPPAYKVWKLIKSFLTYRTEQYFRIILNHRFSFKKYRGISMRGDMVGNIGPGSVPSYTNFNYGN